MMKQPRQYDRPTGPFTREEFATLVQSPFGAARKEIRKHDPFWGLQPGEKVEWEVICKSNMQGRAYVKAASEKEAEALVDNLTCNDVDWDTYSDDFDIISVEPRIGR